MFLRCGNVHRLCLVPILLAGCCQLASYQTPAGISRWQDIRPPVLSLAEKAAYFQARLEAVFQTPEGLLRYFRNFDLEDDGSYGAHADGCFHTSLYLAAESLRYATTGSPAARVQVLRALNGVRLLMEVTGKRGLLARHFTPAGTIQGDDWLPSTSLPQYSWRSDVSKDQYAGFVCGIGVTLAVVDDDEIHDQAAALAVAAADHLIDNDLLLVDVDGEETTHGNLRARIWGLPIGVNALIALAIAKNAAVCSEAIRHREFYERLIAEGYPGVTYWTYFAPFGVEHRVNDEMGYTAIYPLLLLEDDPEILEELRAGERRSWEHIQRERNAFFACVHAALVGDEDDDPVGDTLSPAGLETRVGLFEFPDTKVNWSVDLTRPPFDFSRRFLNSRHCIPRSTCSVPLYLRPRSSNMWNENANELAGQLGSKGESESSGEDYLLAYWMARYHGFVSERE